MKKIKPSCYHCMAYSIEPYCVCLDFPNLLNYHTSTICDEIAN